MTNWAAGMDITTTRLADSTKNDIQTYTPSYPAGKGSATYTTQTGWYYQIGKLVFFSAYIVVNAGGSGAVVVTLQGPPLTIDRTTRQVVTAVRETSGGGRSEGVAVAFTGGTGSIWDRLVFGATDITGAALTAGCLHIIEGWYRTT